MSNKQKLPNATAAHVEEKKVVSYLLDLVSWSPIVRQRIGEIKL